MLYEKETWGAHTAPREVNYQLRQSHPAIYDKNPVGVWIRRLPSKGVGERLITTA